MPGISIAFVTPTSPLAALTFSNLLIIVSIRKILSESTKPSNHLKKKKRKQKKGRVATQHLHQINTLPTRHVHTNKHLRHALRIAQLSLVGQEGFEELVREQHEVHGRGGDFRREGEHCRLVVGKLVVLDEAKGGVEGDGGGEGGDGEV